MAILRPTSTVTLDTGWAVANGATTAHGALSDNVTQPADPTSTGRVDYTETPSVANRTVLVACAQTDVASGTLWVYGRRGSLTVRAEVRDDQGDTYGNVVLPSGATGGWVSVEFGEIPAGRTPRIALYVANVAANTQAPRVWDAYLDVTVQADVVTTDADVQARPQPSVVVDAEQAVSPAVLAAHEPATVLQVGAIPLP